MAANWHHRPLQGRECGAVGYVLLLAGLSSPSLGALGWQRTALSVQSFLNLREQRSRPNAAVFPTCWSHTSWVEQGLGFSHF